MSDILSAPRRRGFLGALAAGAAALGVGSQAGNAVAAEAAWSDPLWKERLKRENDAAIAAGVFGAPFFIVDGEPFWGNDRRAQLEQWLAGQADFSHTVM